MALTSGLVTAALLMIGCGGSWVPQVGMIVLVASLPVQLATAAISVGAGLAGWRAARGGRSGRLPALVGLGVGIGWFVAQVVGWSALLVVLVGVSTLAVLLR